MQIDLEKLDELTRSGARPVLIDVRTIGEFGAGHVPGAIHMPMEEAESRLDDIPTDVPVVLLCQTGSRASVVCDLIQHERSNSMVLEGGTDAWVGAGRPTVCSRRTRWSIDRQVRLVAGLLVLSGTLLSLLAAPAWVYVAMFIGAGLTFSGITNYCGMAALFAKMPWNQPKSASTSNIPRTT